MDARTCPACGKQGSMDDRQRQDNGVYVEYWHCMGDSVEPPCGREWMAIYDLIEVVPL